MMIIMIIIIVIIPDLTLAFTFIGTYKYYE